MTVKIIKRKSVIKIRPKAIKEEPDQRIVSSWHNVGAFFSKDYNVIFHRLEEIEINDHDGKLLWRITCVKVKHGVTASLFIKTAPDIQERQISFLNMPLKVICMVLEDLLMLKDHYVNYAFNPQKKEVKK